MKTLHRTSYWSATDTREKDNIWCEEPDETTAFMETLEQPWIAFKTMAAVAMTHDGDSDILVKPFNHNSPSIDILLNSPR